MFRAYTRLSLIFLSFALGGLIHTQEGIEQAWYLYLAGFLLLLSHVLFGNIWQAFAAMRSGNLPLADRIAGLVFFPSLLLPRPRAYYYFVRGMLALKSDRLQAGDDHLKKALDGPLRQPRDYALALLNRAHIAYLQNDWERCARLKKEAEAQQANDLLIQEHLEKLDKALQENR